MRRSTVVRAAAKLPLTTHAFFAGTTVTEASEHLGLFVGSGSAWRSRGLPWRLYKPGGLFSAEISALEALKRLADREPVRFQRQRVVTVTPDIKALEGIATGLAAPGLSRLAGATKKAGDVAVKADPTGIELKYGLPTTLRSLSELKLFSAIYNTEVAIPSPSECGNAAEAQHLRSAHMISEVMNRALESGVEMYSVEERSSVQFVWYLQRLAGFWLPIALAVLTPLLASDAAMATLGLDALPIAPFVGSTDETLESLKGAASAAAAVDLRSVIDPAMLGESIKSGVQGVTGSVGGSVGGGVSGAILGGGGAAVDHVAVEGAARLTSLHPLHYSSGVAAAAGGAWAVLRAASKTIFNATPLGFQLTAYAAFMRLARGEPIVLQQMTMNTVSATPAAVLPPRSAL